MMIANELKVCVEVNKLNIYDINEKINEKRIVEIATNIEQLLLKNGASRKKLRDVYEATIEMLQNVLNYSYDSSEIEQKKMEANGTFTIKYDSENDTYFLQSCNLIEASKEAIIEEKIKNLTTLDEKGLRKLAREKMRTKRDVHDKGAGLGLISIAKKSSKPMEYTFEEIVGTIKRFTFTVTI
jgi:hypothetical protein